MRKSNVLQEMVFGRVTASMQGPLLTAVVELLLTKIVRLHVESLTVTVSRDIMLLASSSAWEFLRYSK